MVESHRLALDVIKALFVRCAILLDNVFERRDFLLEDVYHFGLGFDLLCVPFLETFRFPLTFIDLLLLLAVFVIQVINNGLGLKVLGSDGLKLLLTAVHFVAKACFTRTHIFDALLGRIDPLVQQCIGLSQIFHGFQERRVLCCRLGQYSLELLDMVLLIHGPILPGAHFLLELVKVPPHRIELGSGHPLMSSVAAILR